MSGHRRYKELRKLSYMLAATHLQTLLPEDAPEVTVEDIIRSEARGESYVLDGVTQVLAPHSSKWFYKKLKRERRRGLET